MYRTIKALKVVKISLLTILNREENISYRYYSKKNILRSFLSKVEQLNSQYDF